MAEPSDAPPPCWCAEVETSVLAIAEIGYDRAVRTPHHQRGPCPTWHTPTNTILARGEYVTRTEAHRMVQAHAAFHRAAQGSAERLLEERVRNDPNRVRVAQATLAQVRDLANGARVARRKTVRLDDLLAALEEP